MNTLGGVVVYFFKMQGDQNWAFLFCKVAFLETSGHPVKMNKLAKPVCKKLLLRLNSAKPETIILFRPRLSRRVPSV